MAKQAKKDSQKQKMIVLTTGLAALIFVLVFYLLFQAVFLKPEFADTTGFPQEKPVQAQEKINRWLDGVPVDAQSVSTGFPVAVMVENHPAARPQSGIDEASIVFEAPVEGGITRFMAVFPAEFTTKEIGPVRSSRPYYLDWALGFDALYLHVGGSPEALEKIDSFGVRNIDQFYEFQYYWRSEERLAPHNVYTSEELMTLALRDKDLLGEQATYDSWDYKEGAAVDSRGADLQELEIVFSTPEYTTTWQYSQSKNKYIRYQAGELHSMQNGAVLTADNLILLETDISIIDDEGRRKMTTIGTGDMTLFRDGEVINGTWRKNSRRDQIQWLDDNGKNITLNQGKTWISVVSSEMMITY